MNIRKIEIRLHFTKLSIKIFICYNKIILYEHFLLYVFVVASPTTLVELHTIIVHGVVRNCLSCLTLYEQNHCLPCNNC